jgi:hypothetical protein
VVECDGACVVDEDLERAELALDPLDRLVDLRAVGDVDFERESAADCLDRSPGGPKRDVEHRDGCARARQATADRLADARAATRHGGHLPLESHVIHCHQVALHKRN